MPSVSRLVAELTHLRSSFEPAHLKLKERLLLQLQDSPIERPATLFALHECLLFLLAHPHSAAFAGMTQTLLDKVCGGIRKHIRTSGKEGLFEHSGLGGTHVVACFSFELLQWLLSKFPGKIAFDSFGATEEQVSATLLPLLPWPLREHFSEGEHHSSTHWMDESVSPDRYKQLQFIVALYEHAGMPQALRNRYFDQLEIFVDVDLEALPGRSEIRGRKRALYFHREPLLRKADPALILAEKLPPAVPMKEKEKEQLLQSIRWQLLCLYRETDPASYADLNDLEVYDAGRGMDIVLLGMDAPHRHPLDTYIGFMAFKNRLPYAYGGAWMLGKMAKIGINVFPSYRGGESAWFFAQLMRVYKQVFQPEYFVAEPYQVGRHNPEGIETGAFWFYYRLGFRPVQKKLRDLAAKEYSRLQADRQYKSSHRFLEKLVEDEMVLVTDGGSALPEGKYDTSALSGALTKYIRQRYKGDAQKALRESVSALCAGLRISNEGVYRNLLPGLEKIALYLQAGGGIGKWNSSEKQDLLNMIAEKALGRDSSYAKAFARHERLGTLLGKLAAKK
ncbi:MAG: hypothetical protein JNL88_03115 [Bacteroidia bacterium]|nr:hypothetical protein [Bacteroidia bacterium]